jgi:hypothetical protein
MLFLKAKSFIFALWSFLRWGDAPLHQVLDREAVCLKCPEVEFTDTSEFCKACGCPRSAVSDLRTKRRMRDAKCPLGKW